MARDLTGPTDPLDPPCSHGTISHFLVESSVTPVCYVAVIGNRTQQFEAEDDWQDNVETSSVRLLSRTEVEQCCRSSGSGLLVIKEFMINIMKVVF